MPVKQQPRATARNLAASAVLSVGREICHRRPDVGLGALDERVIVPPAACGAAPGASFCHTAIDYDFSLGAEAEGAASRRGLKRARPSRGCALAVKPLLFSFIRIN